jgi:predicted amidohydrolase YtcJ
MISKIMLALGGAILGSVSFGAGAAETSAASTGAPAAAAAGTAAGAPAADRVYRNGYVYTVDARDSVQQALAIRGGRIIYVGTDAGLAPFVSRTTRVVDLHGRMLMPGLVDGHMHPLQGGAALLKCNLNYEQLGIEQMQAKIQACLDKTRNQEPDGWLEVVNWFQEGMVPAGVATNRATLDALRTKRPIFVASSFGHTALVNSRAIEIAGITAKTPDPLGGKIGRDTAANPSGILDDAAQDLVSGKLPTPTTDDDLKSARTALHAMRKQGITTFLDAMAVPPSLAAFERLQHEGSLTARAHFALLITPPEGRDAKKATEKVVALARRYDGGAMQPTPGMTVRNVKLFLDGVISAPALSGAMLEPYLTRQGTAANGQWTPSNNRGPEVYFPAPILRALLIDVVAAGFDPHMHADGDRAVREGLDGIQAVREAYPKREIRLSLAHDEIVDPADFPRFRQLDAIPVLSFQWEKPASDTVDNAREYLGPSRFKYMEPAGFLAAAGARIAYGSDWPVDELDEWFALKVGVTRTNSPRSGPKYAGRLSEDAGLSRQAVLRAITMNSSYELHQERVTGSIEVGKFADLIVLDRNVLKIPAEEIAHTKVLQTVVGGRVVYQAGNIAAP